MDKEINDANSLIVESKDQEYVLINLNQKLIDELKKDPKRLSSYFQECLFKGSNICLHEKEPQKPTFDVPTTSRGAAMSSAPLEKLMSNSQTGVSSAPKRAKKAVKLTDDEQSLFDEILVTQVMVQPMLYNPKLKSNKFAAMKAEKWKLVCDKLNQDVPSADTTMSKVKERWIHLRDEYLKRQRLNKKGSGSGFSEIADDQFDELLSGLKDVYELKETASNISEPEKSFQEQTFKSVANRKIQDKKVEEGALEIIEKSSEKFLSAIEGIKDSFVAKKENIKNEDKVAKFCDCLLMELKELDDKKFRKAQIKILQVISELKDE